MADITKLNINGTDYNIKDEIVRGLVTTLQNEGYIKASDIIDVLTSTNANVPLSANQGRELNITKIDNITISGNILRFTANGNTIGSIELPTLTTNQSTQLNTAYNHSQSTHAPSNAEANVQSDWNITDTNSDAYIKNKPTKVSAFTNDAKYVNETYVDNAIENISASNIPIEDIADNFTATNLEEALAELFQFVSNGKTLIASAITDMGIATSNTDSFEVMANNIRMISGSSGEITTHTITNNLTNCTTNNNNESVSSNSSYSATITPNDGYTISSITVTMGGEDVTSSAVSGNNINISNVTGNIIITVNTSVATYTITRNVTNCTSTGSDTIDTSITTTFQTVVAPNNGYILETLTVSMGGVDYTNRPNVITDMEWNGKPAKLITIENVSGNIVITASAVQQSTPPTGGSGGDTGGDTGGDSGELTYTSAVSEDFTTVGECSGISIDSSNNLVASTLDKFGMVKLNKPVRKLQFNVRDNQADHGALCWYIYNTYKDGAMDKYNMIALSNVADGENGKLYNMAIPGTYAGEIDKLDIPAINPGEQLTIEITDSAPTTKRYKDDRLNNTVITTEVVTTQTIKRADGTILTTLTGNMSGWCGQSTDSSPFCSNIQYVPEVVYDNPSYSVKDYKITLSQNGYSEVFDANSNINVHYCQNSKDFVWEDGETYALALYLDSTGSKFRIDGMYPSACGYRLENNESGEPYVLLEDAYVPTINNFNFSVGVRNGDLENLHQVDTELLNDCLYTFNCALPALNYHIDSNSKNTIVLDTYDESWLGLSMTLDDRFVTRINQGTLISQYGDLNSSTENYKTWKGVIVHELGHSLGFADNADHYPTLYTYRRNRARVNYLQAPDIFTLKSLYKEKYNIDISKSQEDINSQVVALGLGTSSQADMPSDRILSIHFDYPMFTNDELYDKSDLIIEGKLEFDRCESINIGSENSPLILEYNIYKIIPNSVIKGEITNYELKIHVSEKIDIGTNNTYKLYLKQFENTPCSLVNIKQGIIEL